MVIHWKSVVAGTAAVAALGAGAWLAWRMEGEPPSIAFPKEVRAFGRSTAWGFVAEDKKSGLRQVRAWQIEQGHIERDENDERVEGEQSWLLRPPLYRRTSHDGAVLEVQTHQAADGSIVRTYTDVTASLASQHRLGGRAGWHDRGRR